MSFEQFRNKGKHYDTPKATIGVSDGGVYFNDAAIEEYLNGEEVVTYYVDEDNLRVGFNFGEDGDAAYRVIYGENGAVVQASAMLRSLGVPPKECEPERVDIEHDDETGYLVVSIESVVEKYT